MSLQLFHILVFNFCKFASFHKRFFLVINPTPHVEITTNEGEQSNIKLE